MLFELIAAARAGRYWRELTFWELSTLAEANLRREASSRAVLYAVIWNAHARTRSQVKSPQEFDPFAVMERRAAAERLRDKYARRETLQEFIKRNQGDGSK